MERLLKKMDDRGRAQFVGGGLIVWLLMAGALLLAGCAALPADRGETGSLTVMALNDAGADSSVQATPTPAPSPSPTPAANGRSFLTIAPPEDQPVGRPVIVEATLSNEQGKPLPNKVLQVRLNGEERRRIRTDEDGVANIYLGRDLPIGSYDVDVEFIGTEAYQSSLASGEFVVRPARLIIQIVPPLAGIGFTLDGEPFYSDEAGVAVGEVKMPGVYDLELLPLPEPASEEDALIEFERWADSVFTPRRDVNLKGDKTLYAGFSRSYLIGQTFVDLEGEPFDPDRIGALTIKSSYGARYTYSDGRPRWRTANRIARLSNGLEATEIQYSIESVIVDGTNVVNQNQQRFFVDGPTTWNIELLLYNAAIRSKDAFFGFSLGDGVRVDYPDGKTKFFPFDDERTVHIRGLARGLYTVQVVGARGMAPETPVALSRDQDVTLKVLSALDMGMAVGLGILVALGLLLYGRPQIFWTPARWLGRVIRGPRRRLPPEAIFQQRTSERSGALRQR